MFRTETELPTPPDTAPVKSKPWWRWPLVLAIIAALFGAANYIPLPMFYAYLPGPMRDVEQLVQVDGARTYSSEGTLYLTTVSVDTDVTLAEFIQASFDDAQDIVDKDQITQGGSLEQLRREARADMRASKQHAMEVAFAALGLARPTGDGARVVSTIQDSPAEGVLQEGDVIRQVNGEPVETTCDVGREIDAAAIGDELVLTIERDGKSREENITTAANPEAPDSPFVGVFMRDVNYRFDTDGVEVDIKTGEIGGPSAGLMMSLAIYDQLTPEDLTRGRLIAGTGEIACDGGVGPIGGIKQKVSAAESKGAEIFLTPVGNVQEAKTVADDIEIVAISNFSEAVDYLEDLQ